jgi:hypothetical protein
MRFIRFLGSWLLTGVLLVGFLVLLVIGAAYQQSSCEELHRLYGPGRCVFERYADPKLVKEDGTVLMLPSKR